MDADVGAFKSRAKTRKVRSVGREHREDCVVARRRVSACVRWEDRWSVSAHSRKRVKKSGRNAVKEPATRTVA
eukprot:1988326-Pleurochrysis_carterae.AAC.2